MSEETKKTSPHIRTFASDMKIERAKHGLAETEEADQKKATDHRVNKKVKKTEIVKPLSESAKQKPAVGHNSVPHPPAKIPAFHELKKQEKEEEEHTKEIVDKNKPVTQSLIEKKPKKTRTEVDSYATVITDTKTDRFKLFPSIISAVKIWFKKITTRKKKKVPTYTIPEASRRKGVIQTATSKTGTVFTADNGTLKEQIRLRRIEEEKRRKQMSESHDPETSWSPYTETGYTLLTAPEEETPDNTINVSVVFKKKSVPTNVSPEVIKEDTVESEEQTPAVEAPATAELPPTPAQEPTAVKSTKLTGTKPEVEPQINEVEGEELINTEAEITNAIISQEEQRTDTNTLAVIILGSVVGVVMLLFVGQMAMQYITDIFVTETSTTPSVETILNNTSLEIITLTQENINRLPALIKNREEDESVSLSEFVITSQNGAVISPSNIFNTLGFNVVSSLHRSMTDMRFLSTNDTENLLLLKFIDEDTVRGGMLFWEQSMAQDMSIVFNISSVSTNTFSDDMLAGVDVRVLRSGGSTILLYGIIDENTALLATDEASFITIVESQFTN